MITLSISRDIFQAILAHLKSVYPMEGCGLLAGIDGRIHQHYPVDNRLDSPSAFEMEPAQLIAAMIDLETQGLSLLAIYHSHPQSAPVPSPSDIRQANYPDAIQIIISFQNPERPDCKAYQIDNGRVSKVLLKIV